MNDPELWICRVCLTSWNCIPISVTNSVWWSGKTNYVSIGNFPIDISSNIVQERRLISRQFISTRFDFVADPVPFASGEFVLEERREQVDEMIDWSGGLRLSEERNGRICILFIITFGFLQYAQFRFSEQDKATRVSTEDVLQDKETISSRLVHLKLNISIFSCFYEVQSLKFKVRTHNCVATLTRSMPPQLRDVDS